MVPDPDIRSCLKVSPEKRRLEQIAGKWRRIEERVITDIISSHQDLRHIFSPNDDFKCNKKTHQTTNSMFFPERTSVSLSHSNQNTFLLLIPGSEKIP